MHSQSFLSVLFPLQPHLLKSSSSKEKVSLTTELHSRTKKTRNILCTDVGNSGVVGRKFKNSTNHVQDPL